MNPWVRAGVVLGTIVAVTAIGRRAMAAQKLDGELEELDEDLAESLPDRVRVADYGVLSASDPRLVTLPKETWRGGTRRVHKAVVSDLLDLLDAASGDEVTLKIGSAWREHRWKSKADYEKFLEKKYGSVKEGKKWLAFDSPHETGLAVDFWSPNFMEANRKTIPKQVGSPAFAWLVKNAGRYGWKPYKAEPWHWEHPITKSQWKS